MPNPLLALLVSIEVSGPPLPQDRLRAIESACSQAAGGRCAVGHSEPDERPDAVAIVSLDGDERRALVEVGRRHGDRSTWLTRDLAFGAEDALIERFRAIGLTIATLVGDVQERETAREASAPVLPTAPAETAEPGAETRAPPRATSPGIDAPPQAPERRERAERLRLRPALAAGALVGSGLESGPPRWGAFGRASLRFGALPVWPTLSFSMARRSSEPDGLSTTWSTLSGGAALGTDFPTLHIALAARLEATLERLGVEQTLPPTDSGSRWLPGVRLGADLSGPHDGPIRAVLGADAYAYQSGTRIVVAGQELNRATPLTWTATLGVELLF